MISAQDRELAIQGVTSTCHSILSTSVDVLVRSDLATLGFSDQRDWFVSIHDLCKRLLSCDLTRFPDQILVSTRDRLNSLNNALNQVANFQLTSGDIQGMRLSLLNQLEQTWTEAVERIGPLLAVGANEAAIQASVEVAESSVKVIRAAERDVSALLQSARESTAKKGVSEYARNFEDEAAYHGRRAWLWLLAAIIVAAFAVVYSAAYVRDIVPTSPNVLSINLAHIFIIAILTYAVVYAARTSAAARHNEVVNRHRMNALNSFETFVSSTNDLQTKNAVLIQATTSIFAPQESGFIKGEQTPYPGSQIVEILRGASGKEP